MKVSVILAPANREAARTALIQLGKLPRGDQSYLGPVFQEAGYHVGDGALTVYVRPESGEGLDVQYIYPLHTIDRIKVEE